MLIVMLMLTMATGTALFTMQSTQFEQRASTSVVEANWARGVAECTTMAAMAYAEDRTGNGAATMDLGKDWLPEGSQRAVYSRKYSVPEPINPAATGNAGDQTGSMSLEVAPLAANAPGGLRAFLPGARRQDSANYPLHSDHDDPDPNRHTEGLRYFQSHWLQEKLSVEPATVKGIVTGSSRTRTVVTGFAEVRVWGDRTDSGGIRENHELDAIARGYIDSIEPR